MKLLYLVIAALASGIDSGVDVLAAKQDHTSYNYFTLRDVHGTAEMESVAQELGIEYVGRIGNLRYRLFRSPKGSNGIVERFLSLGLSHKYMVDDFQHDKPRKGLCFHAKQKAMGSRCSGTW
ncbi:hypothetical protein DSO57_1005723 [Entomophthora muscae]|uniref:Uncharacterized protein n=1 Tax=Entomophthora muscae TaxID=34485 RepID=A0ACC2T7J0_9FUNG|nr:hypothetical protein DSO57_1005723 [Entomophthora muscae]